MRQRVLGVIGLVWGAAVVVYALSGSHGAASASGSYHAGQLAGAVVGAAFFIMGGRALLRSLH